MHGTRVTSKSDFDCLPFFLRRLFVKFASQNHDEEDLSSICVYLRLLRIIAGVIEAQRGDLFGSFCEYINTLRELKY